MTPATDPGSLDCPIANYGAPVPASLVQSARCPTLRGVAGKAAAPKLGRYKRHRPAIRRPTHNRPLAAGTAPPAGSGSPAKVNGRGAQSNRPCGRPGVCIAGRRPGGAPAAAASPTSWACFSLPPASSSYQFAVLVEMPASARVSLLLFPSAGRVACGRLGPFPNPGLFRRCECKPEERIFRCPIFNPVPSMVNGHSHESPSRPRFEF